MQLLAISFLSGLLSIVIAFLIFLNLRRAVIRCSRMADIAGYIALGVKTYLARQLKAILLIAPFLAVAIYVFLGWRVALTFILGVFTSLTTAFLGMRAAVRANVKTANDAARSPVKAFQTAVMGGSVMGFSITGFSLIALTVLYFLFSLGKSSISDPAPLVGFGFGASLAALFAQIGGGIFTKSADVGADLVGKIEKNIPEDDARNPAVIADLVGDNVGDCAGRGSDLFQTLSSDIITGMVIALAYIPRYGPQVMLFPLLQQSVGVLASMIGVLSIRTLRNTKPTTSFNVGMMITVLVATGGSFLLAKYLLNDLSIFIGAFLGILAMLVVAALTRYYAGAGGKLVERIAEASKRGVALNLITGLAIGLQSPLISIVVITVAVSTVYVVSESSLLAIIAINIGTDLLIGYIMTADAFGPITDNATGIAEMSGAQHTIVRSLSSLDAVGNTMKATTKAYAMASGTITSFVLFATFFTVTKLRVIDVLRLVPVAFLFLGTALPYLISSLVIGATAKTALQMVDEVRRQFRVIPGIMEGRAKPDYAACVDISTKNALREMILPSVVSVVIPALVGFIFGAWALGALLIGSVVSAALLGPFFNNTGTAFDNAKKMIEDRGVKGSLEHQAAVAADTVGDPMKDVAGPALLIFMKLIGMAALLIADAAHGIMLVR